MAITYSTLVGTNTVDESLMRWVNKSDIPSALILTLAEKYIYRRLRVKQMLEVVTGTLASGTATDSLVARHLSTRHMAFTGTAAGNISKKTMEELLSSRSFDGTGSISSGKPLLFGETDGVVHFEVRPDANYVYEALIYREPAALSTDTETNFLTDEMPRLIYLAGIGFASEFKKDKAERKYWLGQLDAEINKMNEESDEALEGADIVLEFS